MVTKLIDCFSTEDKRENLIGYGNAPLSRGNDNASLKVSLAPRPLPFPFSFQSCPPLLVPFSSPRILLSRFRWFRFRSCFLATFPPCEEDTLLLCMMMYAHCFSNTLTDSSIPPLFFLSRLFPTHPVLTLVHWPFVHIPRVLRECEKGGHRSRFSKIQKGDRGGDIFAK